MDSDGFPLLHLRRRRGILCWLTEKEGIPTASIRNFIKKEAVLCIAFLAAVVSMIFVPPTAAYADYIDFRVLGLLWSLMAVVALLRSCGFFDRLTELLLSGSRNGHVLSLLLVLLPFFTAMAVTNDVALLTFVPFTIALLSSAGCGRSIPLLLVLQTAAANLGSMATPVGNPQNLFLYARYSMTPGSFFSAVLPWTGLSLVLLGAASLPVLPKTLPVPPPAHKTVMDRKKLLLTVLLFALCLLSVFRVLAWYFSAAVVLLALLLWDRPRLREPDYWLLLTFVCFFVFSGNLGRMDTVRALLRRLLERDALLTSALTSQVISNVPAAVLLSAFTEDGGALLLGCDLGGLGTPVASLASLITMKLYFASEKAEKGRFLGLFFAFNLGALALFLLLAEAIIK